ncbi:sulfotransferase [Mangrovimonas spongiae]|nr:sulfotransferase [Mangrovimonas spongiae]
MQNAILIFSEARGGSTWLMELLHHVPKTILNWEPLHVEKGVVPKEMNLGWRPYLTKNNATLEHKKLFENILLLKRFTPWTTRYVYWKEVFTSKHVVTKFVRANMCLPWIVEQFPELSYKPVFLLRHPIAVALSRLKTFNRLDLESIREPLKGADYYTIPECLNNDRYIEHASFIKGLQTRLEIEVALWCLNNMMVINHPNKTLWVTVCYEDLVVAPQATFEKLLQAMGVKVPTSILNSIPYRRASSSNYHGNLKQDPLAQLSNFLKLLSKEELTRIQTIFDYFELKIYTAFKADSNKKSHVFN